MQLQLSLKLKFIYNNNLVKAKKIIENFCQKKLPTINFTIQQLKNVGGEKALAHCSVPQVNFFCQLSQFPQHCLWFQNCLLPITRNASWFAITYVSNYTYKWLHIVCCLWKYVISPYSYRVAVYNYIYLLAVLPLQLPSDSFLCDCLRENPPSLHLPVFREILFLKFNLVLPWYWTHSLSTIILSISFCSTNLASSQMMADFYQFLMVFSWNSLILGQCILGGRVSGGKG